MARIKYIRVSTEHQNTARQEQNANEFDRVYIDKASGKDMNRPEFQKMLEFIREGDTVVFESFSRISRSLSDLLKILDEFERKGVAFISEKEQISTEGATGRLVVAVLGAISAYEREINAERREFKYREALDKGIVGRPKAKATAEFEKAYMAWKAGEITAVEAIKQSAVGKTTFYKLVNERQ